MNAATGEAFEVKLPQFEGPFDLLLFFIERDELNIHDIPIARITDDFLNYIQHLNSLDIEVASEFIFVAATLMRIKARMLLPRPELDAEGNEIDPKQDLVQKLIEYKKFRLAAEELKLLEEERHRMARRGNIATDLRLAGESAEAGAELGNISLYKLMMVYERLMEGYGHRSKQVKHTVVQFPYTIEQQKQAIVRLLAINKQLDFNALKANSENRVHFVFNFLAVLEMLQQQLLEIRTGLGYNNFNVSERTM